jgi:hypothetical protein
MPDVHHAPPGFVTTHTELWPTPDLPLLKKAVEYVDAHPEEWDQEEWYAEDHCGTVACLAGRTCLLAGDTPSDLEPGLNGRLQTAFIVRDGGGVQDISERARELLGLTHDECRMFSATNDRADLQEWAIRIAARAGEVWDVPMPGWALKVRS